MTDDCPDATLSQRPARLDIEFMQGDTVAWNLAYDTLDLTGCSHLMSIVYKQDGEDDDLVATLTEEDDGGIVADPDTVIHGGSDVAFTISPTISALIGDECWYSHLITFVDGSERTYVLGKLIPQTTITEPAE